MRSPSFLVCLRKRRIANVRFTAGRKAIVNVRFTMPNIKRKRIY